jgi:hypothetical protein
MKLPVPVIPQAVGGRRRPPSSEAIAAIHVSDRLDKNRMLVTEKVFGAGSTLVPCPRQSRPRLPAQLLETAVALKQETPARTTAPGPPDPAGADGLGRSGNGPCDDSPAIPSRRLTQGAAPAPRSVGFPNHADAAYQR